MKIKKIVKNPKKDPIKNKKLKKIIKNIIFSKE